jgi:hypothetical protein
MLGRRPVPSWTSNSSGLAARANRADGVARQVQLGGDRADAVALSQQLVDGGMPLAGPLGNAAGARRGRIWGRWPVVTSLARRLLDIRDRDGCVQAALVPGDHPLCSLAEVVPQVPPVSHLDRPGRAAGGPI